MPPSFKGSTDKSIDHFLSLLNRNKAGRKANDIGIVVQPGKAGKIVLPANGRSYPLVFIGSYGYAVATAADQYTTSRLAVLYGGRNRMGKIRIVYRNVTIGAIILYLQSFAFQ